MTGKAEFTAWGPKLGDFVWHVHPSYSVQWRHNGRDSVSNHQPHHCLLNPLFRRRSKKTSKLRVTGLCAGNSPGTVNSPHKWPVTRKMLGGNCFLLQMNTWQFNSIISTENNWQNIKKISWIISRRLVQRRIIHMPLYDLEIIRHSRTIDWRDTLSTDWYADRFQCSLLSSYTIMQVIINISSTITSIGFSKKRRNTWSYVSFALGHRCECTTTSNTIFLPFLTTVQIGYNLAFGQGPTKWLAADFAATRLLHSECSR